MATQNRLSVFIASTRRPEILRQTLAGLMLQSEPPDEIVVSLVDPDDCTPPPEAAGRMRVVYSAPGLCRQRNCAIEALDPQSSYAVALDDDMELHRDYLANAKRFFRSHPDVLAFNGALLANGGINAGDARYLLDNWRPLGPQDLRFEPSGRWGGLYGCNMNFRREAFDLELFDEKLPLYGELEDADFAARLKRHGTIGRFFGCRAVHLMTPFGRIPPAARGFSQIMNPLYLARKGSVSRRDALFKFALRYPLVNLLRMLAGDPTVDRRERLRGNLYAWNCLLRGRIDPGLITRFAEEEAPAIRVGQMM